MDRKQFHQSFDSQDNGLNIFCKYTMTHYTILTIKQQILQQQQQPFNGLFSRTSRVSRYQKGKTNLDFTGARDSEWQWNQLGHMQVCTLLQTDNHASTSLLSFLQARCPSCRPTNSVKALKAQILILKKLQFVHSINGD